MAGDLEIKTKTRFNKNRGKESKLGWEAKSIDSGGEEFSQYMRAGSNMKMKPNQDITAVVAPKDKGMHSRKPSQRRLNQNSEMKDSSPNTTHKSGYRLLERSRPKERAEGSPDLIGGGDSMTSLKLINQTDALEKLNKQMGSSNSAAFLTKYLELHNLYPTDTPHVKEILKERKPSLLINQNSYVTVSLATEEGDG